MEALWGRVAIVGIGLIGGSLGMAFKNKGIAETVVGVDLRQEIIDAAIEMEAVDCGTTDIFEGVADADLVVLAAPIETSIKILEQIAPCLKKGCVVTDVGSTKREIVDKAQGVMPEGVTFIGGHPMTGSEQAGINAADLYLFENAVYVLTIFSHTPAQDVEKLQQACSLIGSRVIFLDPKTHDFMVAGISHLPHIVAASLVNTVDSYQESHPGILGLAAGGFRDTTRIAAGHPQLWRDILLTNQEAILTVLASFKQAINDMEEKIINRDGTGIEEFLSSAKKVRQTVPTKMKGYLPTLYEVIVTVPDQPGVIAGLAVLLGDEGININDIEILRVKEGEGGSIRLGFATPEDQEQAIQILKANGTKVKAKG